jgi:predicted RNase H-like HicB family nuclease
MAERRLPLVQWIVPAHAILQSTSRAVMTKQFKVIVERHEDGYVAYPIGLRGVVVGQGDTYEQALVDVNSAIQFHIQTFGKDVMETDQPVLDAFLTETKVAV